MAEAAWIYFWVFFFNSASLLLCWYHAVFVIVVLLALHSSLKKKVVLVLWRFLWNLHNPFKNKYFFEIYIILLNFIYLLLFCSMFFDHIHTSPPAPPRTTSLPICPTLCLFFLKKKLNNIKQFVLLIYFLIDGLLLGHSHLPGTIHSLRTLSLHLPAAVANCHS